MDGGDQRQPWPRNWTVYIMNVLTRINMSASGVAKKIINLADGSAGSQDASTVKQMEDHVAAAIGDNVSKDPVDATTTAALPANTRTAEVLTADANGAFPTIDGVAAGLNKTYLVKDEGGVASHINNGIYELTQLGDGSNPWKLTRRDDLTDGEGASGAMTHADAGTVNDNVQFKCINNIGSDVVNTDALQFDFWGETVDHANLKNVTADQHHLEDIESRQAIGYYVSDIRGSDGAGFDGSLFKPFKTINKAISESIANGDIDILIYVDNRFINAYVADMPTDHFVNLVAHGLGFSNVTINMNNTVSVITDGINAIVKEGSGQTLPASITINRGFLNSVTSFAGGNPTLTNVDLAQTQIGAGSILTQLANTVKTTGVCRDVAGDKLYIWDDTDFRGFKSVNMADGVASSDGAAFGQIGAAITTHTGLPNAHHNQAHKDDHDPEDGADPLDTAVPGSIDETANAVGTSHSFSRADHNHQHLAALHENGGGAEISVTGLSGLLADDQHVIDAEVQLAVRFQDDLALAGATPVVGDIAAWTNLDRGIGVGTGGRIFWMYKNGAGALKYVEMS